MPRFFFDIHDDVNVIDNVGLELPNLLAARAEAARALSEAAKDALPGDGPAKDLNMVVRDETGAVALQAQLRFTTEPKL